MDSVGSHCWAKQNPGTTESLQHLIASSPHNPFAKQRGRKRGGETPGWALHRCPGDLRAYAQLSLTCGTSVLLHTVLVFLETLLLTQNLASGLFSLCRNSTHQYWFANTQKKVLSIHKQLNELKSCLVLAHWPHSEDFQSILNVATRGWENKICFNKFEQTDFFAWRKKNKLCKFHILNWTLYSETYLAIFESQQSHLSVHWMQQDLLNTVSTIQKMTAYSKTSYCIMWIF